MGVTVTLRVTVVDEVSHKQFRIAILRGTNSDLSVSSPSEDFKQSATAPHNRRFSPSGNGGGGDHNAVGGGGGLCGK